LQLEVSGDATLAPDGAPLLQVGLLPGDVPGCRDVPGARRLGEIRFNEDLVVEEFGGALSLELLEPNKVHARSAGVATLHRLLSFLGLKGVKKTLLVN